LLKTQRPPKGRLRAVRDIVGDGKSRAL